MKKIIFIIVICTLVSVPVLGDITGYVDLQNQGHWSEQGTVYGDGYSGGVTGYTSIYTWTATPISGEGASVPNWGFCIELPQEPTTGTYEVRLLDQAPLPGAYGTPMSVTQANLLMELWARVDATIGVDPTMTAAQAEAFAACVWEIVYEELPTAFGGTAAAYDVTADQNNNKGGSNQFFYIVNADTTLAQSWLDSLTGTGPRQIWLRALSNADGQDFLVKVPVPAAFILGMLGLSVAGIKLRKFA